MELHRGPKILERLEPRLLGTERGFSCRNTLLRHLCYHANFGHSTLNHTGNGVGTNFGVGVGEARPKGPRAGDGVPGEGQPAPSPPDRGLAGKL